jgi:ATP-binding cassette subfamily A (ABC1) protein 3
MESPTAGTAIVDGYDLRKHPNEVQQHLGFCPQHNLLFPQLTVSEHLTFFACVSESEIVQDVLVLRSMHDGQIYCNLYPYKLNQVKGQTSAQSKLSRDEMLQKLQLVDKRNTLPRNLSGGQKRKLCLGMSLIGGAKVDKG